METLKSIDAEAVAPKKKDMPKEDVKESAPKVEVEVETGSDGEDELEDEYSKMKSKKAC